MTAIYVTGSEMGYASRWWWTNIREGFSFRLTFVVRVHRQGNSKEHCGPVSQLRQYLLNLSVRGVRTDVSEKRSSPILVTLTIEELCSSETSDLTRATRRIISQEGILHIQRPVNLKSYIFITWLSVSSPSFSVSTLYLSYHREVGE
jgi:hypothetical protein